MVFHALKARSLFNIDAYIQSQLDTSQHVDNLTCLNASFINLLRSLHIQHENETLGHTIEDEYNVILGRSTSNVFSLINVTKHLLLSEKGFLALCDEENINVSVGRAALVVFRTINLQLQALITSDQCEKDKTSPANMVAFAALYDCFMAQLSFHSECSDKDKNETEAVDRGEVAAWINSYEALALLLSFIPDDATAEEKDLYMTEITRRVQMSSRMGLVNVMQERPSPDCSNIEELVTECLSNFSQKQSKLQLLLGNPYSDSDVTTSLRLGCSRSPTIDTTTTKIDNSDIILKDENSVNTLCIFINFLMSSTSVHSVLHANIHDLIATDSIASFMSLVISVTTELHHNESFRKNDDKFVLFGMFVERLRYLYQCSTTSNYHNNTDNENDLVYIKSNQNVYSTVTRCKRLQHIITVKLPELDDVLSSFLLDTGRKEKRIIRRQVPAI
jgi:hypothetical protein